MKMKYLSALAIGGLLFSACGKDPVVVQPQNNTQQFELYIDYWNPSGTNPQITFDAVNSSTEVKIDFTKNFTGIPLNDIAFGGIPCNIT